MIKRPRLSRRFLILTGTLALTAAALAVVVLYSRPMTSEWASPLTGAPDEVRRESVAYFGPSSLESRMVRSDVIARVKLVSVAQVVEKEMGWPNDEDTWYLNSLEFKFTALEYLKGNGGSEITAIAFDVDSRYATRQEAKDEAPDFLGERDKRWDAREAIVFLEDEEPYLPSTRQTGRYVVGYVRSSGWDVYSIASWHSRRWLPSASVGSSSGATGASGGQRFYLEEPSGGLSLSSVAQSLTGSTTPTITSADLKKRIAELDAEVKAGDGSEEYRECVLQKYIREGEVRYSKAQLVTEGDASWLKDGYYYIRHDAAISSGLPAKTRVFTDPLRGEGETAPAWAGDFPTMGRDAEQFRTQWPGVADTMRPLPAGEYKFYYGYRPKEFIICDGQPEEEKKREEVFVTVTAPAGTLHELFFDPVTVGSAFVADATNGTLKPTAFTGAGGASATIGRIAYESGQVKIKVTPVTALASQVVDVIELDGTGSLSLSVANATVDAANNTLSWTVSSQPWHNGDKLMVRIHDGSVAAPAPAPTPVPVR